jgi:hypothetical protein
MIFKQMPLRWLLQGLRWLAGAGRPPNDNSSDVAAKARPEATITMRVYRAATDKWEEIE